jgi:hypothetical protein
MVKHFAPVWLTFSCLLMACTSVGQSRRPSAPLPDAPSAQIATQSFALERVADEAHLPCAVDAVAVTTREVAASEITHVSMALPPRLPGLYEAAPPKESPDFFGKHVYPSLINSNTRYRPSDSDSMLARATDAASSVLFPRDETGRRRLNTSYLLRVATSVAAHSASRPYWLRSGSEPISDFGSTVGNDAGMNLLHEFGPAVRHVMAGHLPEFVTRIQEGILRARGTR